jgi:hypothetical protein
MDPDIFWKVPDRHGKHLEDPFPFPNFPASHSEQEACPSIENFPVTQVSHAVAAELGTVPALQFVHDVMFTVEYEPDQQGLHVLEPELVDDFPAGHCRHFSIPVSEKKPGLQNAAHSFMLDEPDLFVLRSSGQAQQADCPVMLANEPIKQGKHVD